MKRLVLFLFFASAVFGQSHEILRPTVDSSSSSTAIGCSGANQVSTAMPNSWDAAGLSTSSLNQVQGTSSSTRYKVRIFSNWAAPTQTYTALSLKINSAGFETFNNGPGGTMNLAYSLNGGSTWNNLRSGTWGQVTDTVSLSTAQDFTKLWVAVCSQSIASGSPDNEASIETAQVWDIWTDGTYSGGGGMTNGSSQGVPAIQPIMISESVDFRRRKCQLQS